MIIECKTQVELDAALKKASADHTIWLVGGQFSVAGSAHVVAWDSVHVVARDSVHIEAWDSAHVEARDSAHVEAWGNVFVRALSKLCRITAAASVVVMLHAGEVKITGGKKIKAAIPRTAKGWCEFYGAEVKSGIATVYKGVRDDYKSAHGTSYAPGTTPVADDWDGGKEECGGGLHFSPRPTMTRKFDSDATKFIACPVRLRDMRKPEPSDEYPDKIKAKGCCAPVWEVDMWGNKI